MKESEEADALRLVVIFLRSYADLTQAEFGEAVQLHQSDVSKFEMGRKTPAEDALGRMAQAADVGWPVVVHLRRAYETILKEAARSGESPDSQPVSPEILEPALLALTPYLLADHAERQRLEEEDRWEADEIWAALERYPIPRRRRLIELAPRASRSRALAAKIQAASLEAAAHDAQEARELGELALFIAGRVPEEEPGYIEATAWGDPSPQKDEGSPKKDEGKFI